MSRWKRRFASKEAPWWESGVNFICVPDCGRCCDEPGGIVYLSREDAERIANHFQVSLKQWLAENCRTSFDGRFVLESKPEDGRCIYLTGEKMCSIYEVKPAQCSAFPFWRENLVSGRSWEKTKELCPGIDHVDAIEIKGDFIKLNLEADRIAEKGFRFI